MRKAGIAAYALGVALVACGTFLAEDDTKSADVPDGGNDGNDGNDGAAATDGADASSVDDAAADAIDAGPCAVEAPFTTVEIDDNLSTSSPDYGLAFSPDGLRAYVAMGALPNIQIGIRTRASTNDPFASFVALDGMPAPSNHWPTVSPDGTELFFSQNTGDVKIWRALITASGAQGAAAVTPLDEAGAEDHPYLANERALYFANNASGYTIRRAIRGGPAEQFGAGIAVDGLGANEMEAKPVVTRDELTIYFAAASSADGLQKTRIHRASRTSASQPFGPDTEVTELRSNDALGGDRPVWLSPDRCTLYFVSTRADGGTNEYDVYVAKRAP